MGRAAAHACDFRQESDRPDVGFQRQQHADCSACALPAGTRDACTSPIEREYDPLNADLQMVVGYTSLRAIVLRGALEQVNLSEWLVKSLSTPSTAQGPALQSPAGLPTLETRVVHLANLRAPQEIQNLVSQIRSSAKIMRLWFDSETRAIAMRATSEQIASAKQLIRDADRPQNQ